MKIYPNEGYYDRFDMIGDEIEDMILSMLSDDMDSIYFVALTDIEDQSEQFWFHYHEGFIIYEPKFVTDANKAFDMIWDFYDTYDEVFLEMKIDFNSDFKFPKCTRNDKKYILMLVRYKPNTPDWYELPIWGGQ